MPVQRSRETWTNRAAGFAVLMAFLVGVVAALSLRSESESGGLQAVSHTAPDIHWRVPVAFGTNLPAVGDNILYVSEILARASSGRIKLQVFEPGLLIPVLSITEGVGKKKITAGYTWLGYDQGKIPASPLISAVPFSMEPWEFTAWYFENGGQAFTEALYKPHNVHPLLCGTIGPETAGWFSQPIESVDDFKGLKIRFAGLGGKVLQRLGASVTMMPGSEIFQALEKGAIDATEFSMPAVDQMLGFDRVAKFNYFPGWHQTFTAFHLVVNLEAWHALAASDQQMIEMACTAGVIRNLSRGEALQGEVMQGFPARGVMPQKLSPEILTELRRVTHEVLSAEADKDADFKRIWESQKAFRQTYQHWKRYAYLPRDF